MSCTDDVCDEVADAVVNTANDANCDDALFCNGAETCDAALDCQGGTAPVIDDGVSCTDDVCDEVADAVVNTAMQRHVCTVQTGGSSVPCRDDGDSGGYST